MGTRKKEANLRARKGTSSDGMANVRTKGENFYRTAKRVKQLNVLKEGKAQRNADGVITKAASYQSKDVPTAVIEPNRKWFTNTRVISQDTLTAFREAVAETEKDPYKVLLKSNKLPMSLIRDGSEVNGLKKHQAKMTLETTPFSTTFGPKAQRKRVKLSVNSINDLAEDTDKSLDTYKERQDQIRLLSGASGTPGDDEDEASVSIAKEAVFTKGQSKRIWNELYRTIDSSDVIIHVLDARDPLGTRCRAVEEYLRKEKPHVKLIMVLNKVDLLPTSVVASWIRVLSKEYPTAAFRSSITNPFGKGSLLGLLRQFSGLLSNRKQVSVGIIGYPNTGKSSLINALRGKKVATVAPIPGETKVWQYITLTKRMYLIDCPGIVPPSNDASPQDLLLRGAVRTEKVENPEQYIPAVLAKTKLRHMERTYDLSGWKDHIHFLELLARKGGRLLKAGEPDVDGVARMVLNDFLRGKIPWFTPPPALEGDAEGVDGREGRLGEIPLKRKRDDAESVADTSMGAPSPTSDDSEDDKVSSDDEFEGFESDSEPDATPSEPEKASAPEPYIQLDASSEEDSDGDVVEDGGVAITGAGDGDDDADRPKSLSSRNSKPSRKQRKAR
ncbi:hypothetical protein PpBr36_01079 [Pyricularia pennisetigena]|uniref:hypothetical protein n=1 Tax=Pyricularia pennisetigena TaxID=1578925 RepID=UPI0011505484|nr:hypothetical protein PpBr36_01079 [Pyricularia pennisetigena]TLS29692.1 hypothetical protein PpBr36_01079 [Pyricularia pennisetigena]